MSSRRSVEHRMLVDAPTNASITSNPFYTHGMNNGWLEVRIPHTGDAVGTFAFKGGNEKTQSTHDELSLDDSQIYINGLNLADNAFTGITWAASAPGTLSVAAAQVADARIRIPAINLPQYVSVVWTRSSGGSATQYIQAVLYLSEA
jgi:hypothetical protein